GVDADEAAGLAVGGAAEVDDVGVGRVDGEADVVIALRRQAGAGRAAADVVVRLVQVVGGRGADGGHPAGDRRRHGRDAELGPVLAEVLRDVHAVEVAVGGDHRGV